MKTSEKQTESIITGAQTPAKRSFRKKLAVFIVCLGISGLMWFFIELTKDYTTELRFNVSFVNVPKDLILQNQNDSSITVGLTAQGFELFTVQLFRKRQDLVVDLSNIHIRKENEGYSAFIPASTILQQVGRQISYSKAISYIRPDTLFFRFSDVYRREVPVKLDLSYTFRQQYMLYDSLVWSPKTVTVSSIKDVIDTIRFATTVRTVKTGIDSSLSFKIPLKRPLGRGMITFSTDSIAVYIPVQKYTEVTYTVPISLSGNASQLKIYPDQAEVTCLVPMVDYRHIEAANFSASVQADNNTLANNQKLKVNIPVIPPGVRVVKLKPEFVEYIIISP